MHFGEPVCRLRCTAVTGPCRYFASVFASVCCLTYFIYLVFFLSLLFLLRSFAGPSWSLYLVPHLIDFLLESSAANTVQKYSTVQVGRNGRLGLSPNLVFLCFWRFRCRLLFI